MSATESMAQLVTKSSGFSSFGAGFSRPVPNKTRTSHEPGRCPSKFEPCPRPCPSLTPLLQRRTSTPNPVRAARISLYGTACVRRNQAQHASSPARPAGCAICSSRCALRLEPADWASLCVRTADWCSHDIYIYIYIYIHISIYSRNSACT